MDEQALERRLALMSEEEREHFKMVILQLVHCYGPDPDQAVLLIKSKGELAGLITMNADDMEAASLLLEANDFFGYLNMAGAPPKEAFN
jgi:hypothetical protein